MKTSDELDSVRLDKWLWAARIFKTRGLAMEAISRGNVFVNASPAKSSRRIRARDELLVRKGPYEWRLVIDALSDRRLSASEATKLYTESLESIHAREKVSKIMRLDRLSRPVTEGKPGKKDRRQLLSLKKRRG